MTDEELLNYSNDENQEDNIGYSGNAFSEKKPEAGNDDSSKNEEGSNDDKKKEDIEKVEKNPASKYLGTSLTHHIGTGMEHDSSEEKEIVKKNHLSRVGENIYNNVEIREGWIPVDRDLLGERSKFYPKDWEFRIRPATVQAIRNWSAIDEESFNSIDDVFNEVIKSCVSIVVNGNPIPWGHINSWDRFFFLLLVREYTFAEGEQKISWTENCPECDNPMTFELNSQSLMYDMPDESIMKYFDQERSCWVINPHDFDLDENPITLYLPTLEKEANIKNWLIESYRENENFKPDTIFLKFLYWMAPKISKDYNISKNQIRSDKMKFESFDRDYFAFLDEVLRNIVVTPKQDLLGVCPVCGEEVTSKIRFQNSIRDLFTVQNRFKKFGTK